MGACRFATQAVELLEKTPVSGADERVEGGLETKAFGRSLPLPSMRPDILAHVHRHPKKADAAAQVRLCTWYIHVHVVAIHTTSLVKPQNYNTSTYVLGKEACYAMILVPTVGVTTLPSVRIASRSRATAECHLTILYSILFRITPY